VVRCRNRLPREVVDALEVFKARLDGALSSLGCYEMWRWVALHVAGGWSFMRSLPTPAILYDSMIPALFSDKSKSQIMIFP